MKRNSQIIIYITVILLLFVSCGKLDEIEIRGADNLRYIGFKDNHVEFEADINIYNPSGYKIKVKEIDMKLIVNDQYLGRLYNAEDIQILPRSEGYLTVPFNLRITNILTGMSMVRKIYNQNNLKVEVEGTVIAKTNLIRKKIDIKKTTYIDSLKR